MERIDLFLWAGIVCAQALDVLSTWLMVGRGGIHEANPFTVGIVGGGLLSMLLLKAAGLCVLAVLWLLARHAWGRGARWVLLAGLAPALLTLLNNLFWAVASWT